MFIIISDFIGLLIKEKNIRSYVNAFLHLYKQIFCIKLHLIVAYA